MLYSKIYEHFYSLRLQIASTLADFFDFRWNIVYLSFLLVLQTASWWLSYYIFKNLAGNLLVLHYNVDFGIDWISDPSSIFYFPFLALLFFIFSLILLFTFGTGRHFRFQSNFLMIGAVLANLGILVALILVYLINFS